MPTIEQRKPEGEHTGWNDIAGEPYRSRKGADRPEDAAVLRDAGPSLRERLLDDCWTSRSSYRGIASDKAKSE
jgi:hypothetical protein